MSPGITSASASSLAGLDVASRRVATAASNIANVRSLSPTDAAQDSDDTSGFRPREIQQVSGDQGAPGAEIRFTADRPLEIFEPGNPDADEYGIALRANVSLEREFSETLIAQRAFEANLAALEAADEMIGALFNEEA